MITPELQQLMDEDPDLIITLVKPTIPQIVGAVIVALNHAASFSKEPIKMQRQMEMTMLNWLKGLSEEDLFKQLDYLVTLSMEKLNKYAYPHLMKCIPKEYPFFNRIRGNIYFELCRHMTYTEAQEFMSV